jgi:hypothetical protein
LDPNLEEVPGGYRDFAIKINIGFYRQVSSLIANFLIWDMLALSRLLWRMLRNPTSNDILIVPIDLWKGLPVKSLIVEMQLLLIPVCMKITWKCETSWLPNLPIFIRAWNFLANRFFLS